MLFTKIRSSTLRVWIYYVVNIYAFSVAASFRYDSLTPILMTWPPSVGHSSQTSVFVSIDVIIHNTCMGTTLLIHNMCMGTSLLIHNMCMGTTLRGCRRCTRVSRTAPVCSAPWFYGVTCRTRAASTRASRTAPVCTAPSRSWTCTSPVLTVGGAAYTPCVCSSLRSLTLCSGGSLRIVLSDRCTSGFPLLRWMRMNLRIRHRPRTMREGLHTNNIRLNKKHLVITRFTCYIRYSLWRGVPWCWII